MKKSTLLLLIGFSGLGVAQIPLGHYDGTDNLSGTALKTKLTQIETSGHQDLGYNWTVFATADRDKYYEKDNSVLDIYSENPAGVDPYNFTIVTNQCGNYNGEGVCYNREHTIPKSTFGDARPMHNDYHHLLATDGYVNGKRSNWPYGEVGTATSTVFGKAGIFSPAFWFVSENLKKYLNINKNNLKNSKFYFVAGKNEDETMASEIENAEKLLLKKSVPAKNILVKIDDDGTHSESYWKRELKASLIWLLK